jgi:hypothetical protein
MEKIIPLIFMCAIVAPLARATLSTREEIKQEDQRLFFLEEIESSNSSIIRDEDWYLSS